MRPSFRTHAAGKIHDWPKPERSNRCGPGSQKGEIPMPDCKAPEDVAIPPSLDAFLKKNNAYKPVFRECVGDCNKTKGEECTMWFEPGTTGFNQGCKCIKRPHPDSPDPSDFGKVPDWNTAKIVAVPVTGGACTVKFYLDGSGAIGRLYVWCTGACQKTKKSEGSKKQVCGVFSWEDKPDPDKPKDHTLHVGCDCYPE